MRSSLVLLAGLAGSALAFPTASPDLDARTFGLVEGLVGTVNDLLHGTTPAHILGGISPEAAAALGGSALGCKAGSIDLEYRKKLASWLKNGAGAHLESSLKKELLSWSEAENSGELSSPLRAQLSFFLPQCASKAAESDLYVTLDGVFSLASEAIGVLTATAQSSLEAAIKGLGEMDWKVRSGLEFCAAGGVMKDLDAEVIKALKGWLNSSQCTLSAKLKKTVLSWIEGHIGDDVIHIPSLPVGGVTAVSLGHSIEALVETGGALIDSAQTSLSAFLETDVGSEIETEIKNLLHQCANGGLAVDIELAKRVELSLWLSSSKCKLTAELKGLLTLWLSFGVSSGAEVSLNVDTGLIGDLTGFLTGTIDSLLGTHIHGLISFILSGKGVLSISVEARAQLAALISGGCGVEIDSSIQVIIIGWLTGCEQCCGGSTPSSTPGLPSSTTAIPATSTPSVPAGASSTPCDTFTSESVISSTVSVPDQTSTPVGVEPTSTPVGPTSSIPVVPSSPAGSETPSASSTPCDTFTSETVISSTVSVPDQTSTPVGVEPTGTPVGPTSSIPVVPSGPAGSEAPGSSSTPCETFTSETVVSSTVSVPDQTPVTPTNVQPTGTPSGPTSIPVVPSAPAGSEAPGSSSTPCETFTSETVVSSTVSVPDQTSIPDVQPTGTPSGPTSSIPVVPSAPAGSEAPGSSSTPCETFTSETVVSSTVSVPDETPAPTNVEPTSEAPAPSETAPGSSSTPCETFTSETVVSSTVSVPDQTPVAPTNVQPTGTPAGPGITQAPAPSQSGSCASCGVPTVTVTKTVGVASCPPNY